MYVILYEIYHLNSQYNTYNWHACNTMQNNHLITNYFQKIKFIHVIVSIRRCHGLHTKSKYGVVISKRNLYKIHFFRSTEFALFLAYTLLWRDREKQKMVRKACMCYRVILTWVWMHYFFKVLTDMLHTHTNQNINLQQLHIINNYNGLALFDY